MKEKTIGYRHAKYAAAVDYASTMHIPALNTLLLSYSEKAKSAKAPIWYVKGAALYFTYDEKAYVIHPADLGTSSEVLDTLERTLTDDLFALGAYDMFYAGMMD